jgi:alanine-synthesizing transaminase
VGEDPGVLQQAPLIENEHRLRQAARGIRDMFRKDGLLRGAA